MKRLLVVLVISCLFLGSCTKIVIHPEGTRMEQDGKSNSKVLSILYPYARSQSEYYEIFQALNDLSYDTLGITVDMITEDENSLYMQIDSYDSLLNSMMAAGLGPDIFALFNTFDFRKRMNAHNKPAFDLIYAIERDYAADVTDYINGKTPYLDGFFQQYGNVMPMCGLEQRIYGIPIPYSFMDQTICAIEKSINYQLGQPEVTTLKSAIDVCISIYEKNLVTPHDIMVIPDHNVLKAVASEHGYYYAFDNVMNGIYYFNKNDDKNTIYRIDDTPILGNLLNYRDIFESCNINNDFITLLEDSSKSLISCITTYGYFITLENIDHSKYDIYFLEDGYRYTIAQLFNQMRMFAVSTTCADKQTAVQYIDWLYSDPKANLLVKYGIKDIHYKINPENNLLYVDKTVRAIPRIAALLNGFTVPNTVQLPETYYINGEEEHISDLIMKSYTIYPFTRMALNSIIHNPKENIAVDIGEIIGSELFSKAYKDDYNIGRQIISPLFDKKKVPQTDDEIMNMIIGSRNTEFIDALQDVLDKY